MAGQRGIEVAIGSETKAFRLGIQSGVIAPVEDAEKALKDLGDSKGPEELERSLEDAQKATVELQTETKRAARLITDEFGSSYRKMRTSSQDATVEASENMREVKTEALANAAETFSSFDGDVRSFADGIQGTLGGLVAGIGATGPGGLLAAIGLAAGAAGVGLLVNALTGAEEKSQAVRDAAGEIAAEWIQTGRTGKTSIDQLLSGYEALVKGGDKPLDSLDEIAEKLEQAGLTGEDNFARIADAMAGNYDILDDLIAEYRVYEAAADAAQETATNPNEAREYSDRLHRIQDIITALEEQQRVGEQAGEILSLSEQTLLQQLETRQSTIEAVNDAYDEQAGKIDDFLNEESGLFDTQAYIASMQQREQALRDYQDALAVADLSAEAKSFLNEQGADAAAAMLAGYAAAEPDQRAELNRIWTEAAAENSGQYLTSAQVELGKAKLRVPAPDVAAPDVRSLLDATQRELDRNPLSVTLTPMVRFGVSVG